MEVLNYKIAPKKTFRCFVGESHIRFQQRSNADKFLEIYAVIKYTVKFKDHKHSLNFLNINP